MPVDLERCDTGVALDADQFALRLDAADRIDQDDLCAEGQRPALVAHPGPDASVPVALVEVHVDPHGVPTCRPRGQLGLEQGVLRAGLDVDDLPSDEIVEGAVRVSGLHPNRIPLAAGPGPASP